MVEFGIVKEPTFVKGHNGEVYQENTVPGTDDPLDTRTFLCDCTFFFHLALVDAMVYKLGLAGIETGCLYLKTTLLSDIPQQFRN